jgi:hypothetical protein
LSADPTSLLGGTAASVVVTETSSMHGKKRKKRTKLLPV